MRPSDWDMIRRLYPNPSVDPRAYLDALQDAKKLATQSKKLSNPFSVALWESVGPTNTGGRITDIEFDPVSPNVVFAGAATGGVFKSLDTGNTWIPVFDEYGILNIGDIAIDPIDPDIIYIGTGEANGGHNNFAGAGVFRSIDGGASWQHIGLESTTSIGRIVVDPKNPNRVFVAATGSYFGKNPERGVYRSLDKGNSWELVLSVSDSTGAIDLTVHPDDPDLIHAAMWERVRRPRSVRLAGPTSGIYRSTNGGESWTKIGSEEGIPSDLGNVGRIGLTVSPSHPDILYALFNNGVSITGLFRSDDRGASWTEVASGTTFAGGSGGFSWYFGQVRVSPTNPDKLWVLDVGLMSSSNAGASWSINIADPVIHVDHHALAFNPADPNILLLGNDGGIDISTNGGESWTPSGPLPVTQFYEITFDPLTPGRYYGGTQDNGTIRTLNGGPVWSNPILGGDGFYTIVHPRDSKIIYAESQNGLLSKSIDGGASFSIALSGINQSEPTNWSTPIAMDQAHPDTLYYGTNRVYRSTNGAQSWTPISEVLPATDPPDRLGTITVISIAPSNSDVIYVGTDDAKVWISTNAGLSWNDISAGLPERWVTRIAINPDNADEAFVSFSGLKWKEAQPHVFRTVNAGQFWLNVSANLPDAPVNALALDPNRPGNVYVGTDVGAFVSQDSGQSWSTLGTGMPSVSVYDLKVDPVHDILLAGTHGRSMYILPLPSVISARVVENPEEGTFSANAYPNPFSTSVSLEGDIPFGTSLRIRIFDLLGREIFATSVTDGSSGRWSFTWDGIGSNGRRVPTGTYIAVLEGQGKLRVSMSKVLVKT